LALETYRKKRQFDVTSEPRGRQGTRAGHHYVIQKHDATRLHYDLRLELEGVMKSWAVTRGPSLDPNQKRLAVHVEDHPIEYNTFEGTIPEGEYGGGTVMIWDRGTWTPEGDPHKGYAKGHLDFDLHGEKLKGRWHLVRMRPRAGERGDNWLLIKAKDEAARGPRDPDILKEEPLSVATGRTMEEIAAGKGKKRVWHSGRAAKGKSQEASSFKRKIQQIASRPPARPRTKSKPAPRSAAGKRTDKKKPRDGGKAKLPGFIPLSLAALFDKAPSGPNWLHEIKFDGYRMETRLDHGTVRLLTRKQQDWTRRFPAIAEAVAKLNATTAILDGEVVVDDARGISSFSLLQTDLNEGRNDRFRYCVFDLLYLDGHDLTGEPLSARKAELAQLLKGAGKAGVIRYTDHFDEPGPVIFRHACELGLEGIVSKRRDAAYRSGRSDNFIKTKCLGRREFVVVGYTQSAASPRAIGALIVAEHVESTLRYAGRVGTGYTHKIAHELFTRLHALRTERRPVELPADEKRKDIVWVEPKLVVEIDFIGVTHGGVLRGASFEGVREDKAAREVVREVPVAHAAAAKKQSVRRTAADPKPVSKRKAASVGAINKTSGGALALTHPDRLYWPDAGVTKKELAEYYLSIWDWIRPHIVDRALSLVRAPEGITGETFFQKHIAANIKSSPLRRAVPGKDHDVIAVATPDELVEIVQLGALEIHVRGSRLENLEMCDRIVFDFDPGAGVAWPQMIAAAREIRERLKAEKLESFVKLTGGKGLHVAAPIANADWDAVKLFTQRVAAAMSADSPTLYLAKMTKAEREGRIFIDYLRNSREATAIAPYSTRARPGAPVSTPIPWERLARTTSGHDFSVRDLKNRVKEDAWAEIGKVRQKLPEPAARRR
jgi:bifunctional non-homologous end joining protein LigD